MQHKGACYVCTVCALMIKRNNKSKNVHERILLSEPVFYLPKGIHRTLPFTQTASISTEGYWYLLQLSVTPILSVAMTVDSLQGESNELIEHLVDINIVVSRWIRRIFYQIDS